MFFKLIYNFSQKFGQQLNVYHYSIKSNFHPHDVCTHTYLLFTNYLSHVVISVPLQGDMHAPCQEGTEALSPRARQADVDTARG